MAATPYEKTLERALKLLSYKPRSVAELRERLLEKEWADETTVDQVIARLRELGYLNDEQFALSYATSRLNTKPLGRTRLRRDLQRKKLPTQTVENTLDEAYNMQSEEDLIERAIDKRLRLKGPPSTRQESKKLFDYLIRRGFSYDLVLCKLREIGTRIELNDEYE
ncbi:MAG: RecX family transcriptional regulator [Acidobacteria bacterium]|nr:RecX family transcriptional regulator [Acidobacteriota bacterium]